MMRARVALAAAALYGALVVGAYVMGRHRFALGPVTDDASYVVSVWHKGTLARRTVIAAGAGASAAEAARGWAQGESFVIEAINAEGPLTPASLPLALVSLRDGVRARLEGKTAYVTPDDLVARGAYNRVFTLFRDDPVRVATDGQAVFALLAERLATTPEVVRQRASLTRVRAERLDAGGARHAPARAESLTRRRALDAVVAGARYLVRAQKADGSFRYDIDSLSGKDLEGYSWPRHAGTVDFLARVAGVTGDASVGAAAVKGAEALRRATVDCGAYRCVGSGNEADLGSSALGLLAYADLARAHLGDAFAGERSALTAFLVSLQRPDGEFMHVYDRQHRAPRDVQRPYYSGEAILALARTSAISGEPAPLDAAARGLAYQVGPGWSFVGSRYYVGEQHWVCQALSELWSRVPSPAALGFCRRYIGTSAADQYLPGESPFALDGLTGDNPMLVPRVPPLGARCEGASGLLEVELALGDAHARATDTFLRAALAASIDAQYLPGPSHLFATPAALEGGVPEGPAEPHVRIDFVQHTDHALLRWYELSATEAYKKVLGGAP